jgi:hypothetical protein
MKTTVKPSARAMPLGERTMAIGAVVLSLPVALFGSVYVSLLNGLVLWQGFAAYAILGFITLLLVFTVAGVEAAVRGADTANARTPGPRS